MLVLIPFSLSFFNIIGARKKSRGLKYVYKDTFEL